MNFLAPLFLIGAAAIALPIVFHLIRRSSKEHIPFSSLMFLQPAPPRVTKRSRLEHILLLLLRCLVLCLLALAFARPFLQKPMMAAPVNDRSRKIILLIDTSASMQREGLWAAAVARAGEVLRQTSPGDQVTVYTFDSRIHSLVTPDQQSAANPAEFAALVLGRLNALKPGWGSTHLGSALTAAAEAFAASDKQNQTLGERRIVLITDLQEGSHLDGLQGYEWPRGVDVQLEVVRAKKPTNAGLQWIVENQETSAGATNLAVRIRVSNSSDAKREQFQLRWDGVASAPLEVYVPPGQNRIVAAPALPTDVPAAKLVLSGDDEDFDNSVNVLAPRAERVNVIYLGDEAATDSTQPLFYLKRAFQQTLHQIVEVKTLTSTAPVTSAALAESRLLIATDRLPEGTAREVAAYVTNGGTLLFAMKNPSSINEIIRQAGVEGLTADEATVANYAMFGSIDFTHPLFAPFSDPRFNDFTKIHFWKYRRIDASKIPGAHVLAKFDSGDPALLEIPRGRGRLLLLTSGWQPVDSQFALSSKFVPLLYAMLDLSGGITPLLTQVRVGEAIDLASVAASVPGQPLVIRKPDGVEAKLPAGQTHFNQTDLPGLYSVTSVQPSATFAVNLDAAESRTAPLPVEDLERLGVPLKLKGTAPAQATEQKIRLHDAELENRQKLWRWLTLAALMLLITETWVAGWLSRRASFQTGAET